MEKICTTIEQSKKLIELGIDVNTADMWWAERYEGRVTENGQYIIAEEPYYYPSLIKPSDINYSQDTIKDIPAWSLAALLEVLPKIVKHETLFIETSASLWHIGYRNIYIARADDLLDACVKLIIKLKEQNLI